MMQRISFLLPLVIGVPFSRTFVGMASEESGGSPAWLWGIFILLAVIIIGALIYAMRSQPQAAAAPVEVDTKSLPVEAADDLEIVEGIGPKIAGLLKEAGITTYAQLAAASPEQLEAVLSQAKLGGISNPATWGQQAAMAADGKWDELKALQAELKAGRQDE